ncbi:MAG: type II toxin-antitoxin system HicA family toxin, partial [Anaerolineaceae bacterium]|nr:type II toxin-antitoxin system HicA family toxin [Anaerolineaceae bacterium]
VATKEKTLERVRNNRKGRRFQELRRLLERFGFVVSSKGGSHFSAIHLETGVETTLVNHPGDLPPGYAKRVVEAIDMVLEIQRQQE